MNKAQEYIKTELKNPFYSREINTEYALLRTIDKDKLRMLYKIPTNQKHRAQ